MTKQTKKRRILVAITGASGAIYGVRLLEMLRGSSNIEVHLTLSKAGRLTLGAECSREASELEAMADVVHSAFGDLTLESILVAAEYTRKGTRGDRGEDAPPANKVAEEVREPCLLHAHDLVKAEEGKANAVGHANEGSDERGLLL